MSEPRVVKRYSNRKLYDTTKSCYVTLEQVAELIRAGQDVQVIDNASKVDLTCITLAQILVEQEKKQHSFLSLPAMRQIIRSGPESADPWTTVERELTELRRQIAVLERRLAESESR